MDSDKLYYLNTNKYKITLSISIAVFLVLFLAVFLPFGVNNYDPNHKYTLVWIYEGLSFAFVTFLGCVINEFLVKPIFIKRLTIWKLIIWSIWSFILYGILNFINYNLLGNWHDFNLKSGINFIIQINSIIVFPMLGTIFYSRHKALQKHFNTVVSDLKNKINPSQLITFLGQGNNETIVISSADFLFAQAQDNYVELTYLKDGKISKHLLRTTFKNLKETVVLNYIHRCHRSFIVNLYQVQSINGSFNNLSLHIRSVEYPLPVSKTYAHETLLRLKDYKQFH